MIIRHSLPTKGFTRIDRSVFTDPSLSDGAVRLYSYLCSLKNGANFSDKYICKALGISQRALTRRKKELKDRDLFLVEQVGTRVYVIYIGYPSKPASYVKQIWEREDDNENQTKEEKVNES